MLSLLLLLAACIGLLAGPLLDYLARSRFLFRSGIDGALIGLMVGFLGLEVLPSSFETVGLGALALVTLGLLSPVWLRQLSSYGGPSITLLLAVSGLLLHCLMDGWVIHQQASYPSAETLSLGLAVIIHRLPISGVLWRLLRQQLGLYTAIGGLILLVSVTALGYALGSDPFVSDQPLLNAYVQAYMAGLLLHVIFNSSPHAPPAGHILGSEVPSSPSKEAIGFIAGIVITYLAASSHHHASLNDEFGHRLTSLWLETSPALLIGFLGAGFISVLLPEAPAKWVAQGSRLSQAIRGVIFGLPIPICSCSVVPIYRSLLSRNFPTPAALAFLVAAPELGLESILLTIPLLGSSFTLYRIIAAGLLAIAAGYLVSHWTTPFKVASSHKDSTHPADSHECGHSSRHHAGHSCGSSHHDHASHHHHHDHASHHHHHDHASHHHPSSSGRWQKALRYSFVDVVDDVAAWICIGLVVAAAIPPDSLGESMAYVPSVLHVPLAVLLGIPMYVCASGATPITAALIAGGLSPGAGLAFLLAGPSTNVTTFGLLRSLHGTSVATRFGLTMLAGATLIGWAADLAFLPRTSISLPILETEQFGGLAYACGFLVAAIFMAALFRRGPQGLVQH